MPINTREKIILVTVNLIATEGLINATAGNIAKNGDFNKSNIFYYFDTIDDLLYETLIYSIEKITPIVESTYEEFDNIENFLNHYVSKIVENKEKVIALKTTLSFAQKNMYLESNFEQLRGIVVDELVSDLVDAISYYENVNLSPKEIRILSSLAISSFNGLGVMLLIHGSNEKFMENWKTYTKMLNNYIKK